MKSILWLTLSLTLAQDPTQDLLRQMKALGEQAAKLLNPVPLPPTPISLVVRPTAAALQDTVNTAVPGTIIELEPGQVFPSTFIPPNVKDLTITTRGWTADRLVLPTDAPQMATIQGSAGQSYGMLILGSNIRVRGVRFTYNPPIGQGEMIRVGNSEDSDITHVPADITISQVLLQGNTGNAFGQKRGIAANGRRVLIDQVWCENIWVPGQDSQCVSVWSTPGPVMVRRSVLSAGSENMIVGGTPPAGPAFLPEDITLEDSVLWKPLAWKGATPARTVKNLFEIKFGHRITARHNWMQYHWQQAQPGPAIVLTMATNGACGYCDGRDWTFEDNVVMDVSAGVTVTGYQYSYAPGAGPAVGVIIRNNLFVISKAKYGGSGHPLDVSNEPKNILVDRNTFVHDGNAFLAGDYGSKWPFQDPPLTANVKGGPVTGLVYTNNAVVHGAYGLFTPEGNTGANFSTYFPGAVISGNVMAGAPAAAVTKYNAAGGGNSTLTSTEFFSVLGVDYCGLKTAGADCTRLPFALRALVPVQ